MLIAYLLTFKDFYRVGALKRAYNKFKEIYILAQGNSDFERYYLGIVHRKLLNI